MFLGYKDDTKGFILYDLHNHTTFVSRNVIFYENSFPFKINQDTINQHKQPQPNPQSHSFLNDTPIMHRSSTTTNMPISQESELQNIYHEIDTPVGPFDSATSLYPISNILSQLPLL